MVKNAGQAEERAGARDARVVPLPTRRPENRSARREAFLKHFEDSVDEAGQRSLTSEGHEAHRVVAELNELARNKTEVRAPRRRRRPELLAVLAALVVVAGVVVAVLVSAR